MARTGRRRGPNATRDEILEAARRRFADAGYDATSIRAVAAEVGVDPGVVIHFFGSKDGLFQAAVGWPIDPELIAERIAEGAAGSLGERLARTFLGFWDDPATRAPLSAILRSAMTHEASAALLREFVTQQLFARVGGLVEGPQGELRANLAASQLIGVAVLRYMLGVEPIASVDLEELVRWLTPALDIYLDGEGDGGAARAGKDASIAPTDRVCIRRLKDHRS